MFQGCSVMQIFFVFLVAVSVSASTFDSDFAYVSENVLPQFPTEQNGEIYILSEETSPNRLRSVLFTPVARDKTVPSPVSPLRFVYDETEARTHYPEARDIVREVSRFLAEHATVDTETYTVCVESQNTQTVFQLTEHKLFFVSFPNSELSVQEVPEGIADVSVFGKKENNNVEYLYKKEKEHGNLFDSFLITEERKREDRWKIQTIKNFPGKRKEAALLLSFLAEKEFQIDLEAALFIHGEEGNKWGLKIPYGVSLLVSEKSSGQLKSCDLTDTRIKRLLVSSFDITKIGLKNTTIEELFLTDEAALDFFCNSIEKSELCVEKLSFGSKSNPQSEKVLKLIKRIHEREGVVVRKIQRLVLCRNNFFAFLEEASRTAQKEIHVEDLAVTQSGKDNGSETSTRIFVSKKISIIGNARVLLFIELGPELSHLDIGELQKQCRSPGIDIPKINIVLTKNKINVKETPYSLQFLKKNITATKAGFFTKTKTSAPMNTKIKLAAGEMESIVFGNKGFFVLPSITNEKINVRCMEVMDTVVFSEQEKEEIKKKEFAISEKLCMTNTGIFFMKFLGEKNFIPVIEIEIDCFMKNRDGFEKGIGIHVEANALLVRISPGIERAGEIKQMIGEMITKKEAVVDAFSGYQKLVFEEDIEHEEQREPREFKELSFKGKTRINAYRDWFYAHHHWVSGYPNESYED
ncbi:MAG: uncharacterized protein A8A55_2573 [Amphiamblys sp. WSBS2006]|nr:MAG: uncharacterized protein A8A55_2573 [Amphiamblys sp. WSBS2006]